MPRRLLPLIPVLLVALGCGHESAASQDVRSAAAVALDCDPSEIKLDERRPQQTVATGCGKQQIYVYKCFGAKTDKKDCKWVPVADPGN